MRLSIGAKDLKSKLMILIQDALVTVINVHVKQVRVQNRAYLFKLMLLDELWLLAGVEEEVSERQWFFLRLVAVQLELVVLLNFHDFENGG